MIDVAYLYGPDTEVVTQAAGADTASGDFVWRADGLLPDWLQLSADGIYATPTAGFYVVEGYLVARTVIDTTGGEVNVASRLILNYGLEGTIGT